MKILLPQLVIASSREWYQQALLNNINILVGFLLGIIFAKSSFLVIGALLLSWALNVVFCARQYKYFSLHVEASDGQSDHTGTIDIRDNTKV